MPASIPSMKALLILEFVIFGCSPIPVISVAAQITTGSVSGIVVCNDTNAPARGATVSLIALDRFLPEKAIVRLTTGFD